MSIEGEASISRAPAERNVKAHQFNQPMNQHSPAERQVATCIIINHNGRNSTPKFGHRFPAHKRSIRRNLWGILL